MPYRSALVFAVVTSFAAQAGRIQPWRDPAAPIPEAAASPHLNYYGGRILDQVKVYSVNWGPNVTATVKNGVPGFYGAITSSALFDWLTEYNTNISGGTNQLLKHGSFAGTVTLTPSTSATSLTDAQIQAEIQAQQHAGVLAAPDGESLFMINFPPGFKITMQGAGSCVSGGFCAYHGTIAGSPNTYYAVLPDMSPGSGCDVGCGHAAQMIDNYTSVASHELVEAVTDPGVGLASTFGPPLAWYDPQSGDGEIGDICNASQATFVSGGTTYTMQKEWSNLSNKCIGADDSDAFSLAISPASQTVAAGVNVSYTVKANLIRGATQTIALSVSGLPSGTSGTFSPPSISTGGTSTLTVSAGSSALNGNANFTVAGAGSKTSATASASVSVTGGGGGCPAGYHEQNGVCVPDSSGGCSTSSAGFLGLLALLLVVWRRSRDAVA